MVNPLIIAPILELGKSLLDRFIPDAEERRKAEAEFLRMTLEGDLKLVIAQLEINAKEAQHESVFVAGWRPFFGWSGGVGFVYSTMIQPMLAWYSAANNIATPPELNIDLLWVVITGMLGIGGMRTYEKKKGVA